MTATCCLPTILDAVRMFALAVRTITGHTIGNDEFLPTEPSRHPTGKVA